MTRSRAGSTRRTTRRKLTPKARGIVYGYRSGLEDVTVDNLSRRKIPFLYEKGKIPYEVPARTSHYKPDFFVRRDRGPVQPLPDDWYENEDWWKEHFVIETKGRFMVKDRQKHLLIKKQYPYSDIRFVFSRKKNRDGSWRASAGQDTPIRKGSPTTYGMWCEKHGFLFADQKVPNDWFKSK